ncbi:MAG TPA: NADP-dependent isocitrate dehydrogenase, partial [Xanthobacteraceae bacterium]|nr:NADP-dependent isocitrate dehydrogenase [Xanthobacteraceae bacterium]
MANTYEFARVPAEGDVISFADGEMSVPARPIIPYIEGDGTGPDIWRATSRVLDAALESAYDGERKII